jgi:hypothetical protein
MGLLLPTETGLLRGFRALRKRPAELSHLYRLYTLCNGRARFWRPGADILRSRSSLKDMLAINCASRAVEAHLPHDNADTAARDQLAAADRFAQVPHDPGAQAAGARRERASSSSTFGTFF